MVSIKMWKLDKEQQTVVLLYSYVPYPGGGEKWGGNGVGDDLYSFGFDGAFLWSGGRSTQVISNPREPYIRKSKSHPNTLPFTDHFFFRRCGWLRFGFNNPRNILHI